MEQVKRDIDRALEVIGSIIKLGVRVGIIQQTRRYR